MMAVAPLALLLLCVAPAAALRLPPRFGVLRQERRAAAVALAVSAALATPLAAGALSALDAAPTLTIAVVCDSSGRCTKPPAAKGAAPPLSAAEKLKKDSVAQAERLKKDAARASIGGMLMCAGDWRRRSSLPWPLETETPGCAAQAAVGVWACTRLPTTASTGKEARKSAVELSKDAKKALPFDPNP